MIATQEVKAAGEIDLKFHRQQALLLTGQANEILFGGAAGGGKSHGMRAAMIYFCLQIPGLTCVLFRRTYPELVRNHLMGPGSFREMLASLVRTGHAKIVKGEIRFWNGSKIILSHLQHETSVTDWLGAEIHLLAFDELTHFTETMYRYLRSRLRLGNLRLPDRFRGMFPRMMAGTNPGGTGHIWVKNGFIKAGPYVVTKMPKEEGGMRRVFIPSLLVDNPSMLVNDPDYEDKLHGLGDPVLVRAMLEGDWDVVAGAMFGDSWRRTLHVCDPFPIPIDWPIWRGGDDGFAAPSAVVWLTEDPQTKTCYVIDEYERAGMLPDPLAEAILRHDRAIPVLDPETGEEMPNPVALGGIYDAAAFGDTGQQASIPRGAAMNKLGCKWKPCEKWPGSRVARCQHLHRMLGPNPLRPRKEGGFWPKLQIFSTCRHLIEQLPALPRDPDNPEDVDTDAVDHLYDALTYGLQRKAGGFRKREVSGL